MTDSEVKKYLADINVTRPIRVFLIPVLVWDIILVLIVCTISLFIILHFVCPDPDRSALISPLVGLGSLFISIKVFIYNKNQRDEEAKSKRPLFKLKIQELGLSDENNRIIVAKVVTENIGVNSAANIKVIVAILDKGMSFITGWGADISNLIHYKDGQTINIDQLKFRQQDTPYKNDLYGVIAITYSDNLNDMVYAQLELYKIKDLGANDMVISTTRSDELKLFYNSLPKLV